MEILFLLFFLYIIKLIHVKIHMLYNFINYVELYKTILDRL